MWNTVEAICFDCFLLETELEENGMESFDSSKEGIWNKIEGVSRIHILRLMLLEVN